MNKIFIYLLLLGLIIYVHAADVMVNVGNAEGENVFEPAKVMANPGDNVVFTWVSRKHSVIETDSLTACAKSAKPDAFSSEGAFDAPKTWTLPIPPYAVVGKTWFYCGVPGHCTPGTGGMSGTLIIAVPGAPAPGAGAPPAAPPAGGLNPIPSNKTMPGANSPSNNNTNNTPIIVGAIIGSLIGGSLLTIGSFLVYKKFIKKNDKNKNVILEQGDSNNNFDSGQMPKNEAESYNHGRE